MALGFLLLASGSHILEVLAQGEATAEPGPDPAEVLAYSGDVTLSQLEIDASFSTLPESSRLTFIRDGGAVDQLIRELLKSKLLAAEAIKAGYDREPLMAARLQLETEKVLAQAWLQKVMAEMPEADYEALAWEDYLANPDRYRRAETLDLSHILIAVENCSPEGARRLSPELAQTLREDPSQFDVFIAEYSDDPSKADNGGRYPAVERGMMVAPFEKAAFRLQKPGEISDPVRSEYGWHIIRLNGRGGKELPEFDEVRDEAIAAAQRRHVEAYRDNYLTRVLATPIVVPPESVEIMAKRHFGENLELAPDKPK